ncbi:magnesium chelatase domain-containing protein [Streptomyces sp. NPDC001552]|uniref:magnesium chelatase domain-containing protein n=1 Tax=Streptomyces sp. NPDC001552 TaxID=3364587 RepID=UPI0036955E33
MSVQTITAVREFIIIGQDQGDCFQLWDVAPAPADPTKRAIALEELGVDVADALGDLHTEYATSARAAVDQLLGQLRERSGLDSYGLHPGSNLDAYGQGDAEPASTPAPEDVPYGSADALAACWDSAYRVHASSAPGLPVFNIDGLPGYHHVEIRDRVRAGIINSNLAWPMTNVLVKIAPIGRPEKVACSALDLAVACAVLAAAGDIHPDSLTGVTLIGELGLDGRLRVPRGLQDLPAALRATGNTTVIVPDGSTDDAAHHGYRVITATSLNQVLGILAGNWHHSSDCVHCGDDGASAPAHAPCVPAARCAACPAPF